jgi:hypothetical protein
MNGFMGSLAPYTNGNSAIVLIDERHAAKLQTLNQIRHPSGVFVFIEVDPHCVPNYFQPPYYSPSGASYVDPGLGVNDRS